MTARLTLLHAVAAAALFGLSGAAYAADAGASVDTGAGPGVHAGATTGNTNADMKAGESAGQNAAQNESMPSQDLVGKDVKDQSGDTIGQVSSIAGDQVVIATSQALGIGARDVAVPWSRFDQKTADNLQLQMSKDQIKQLPAYKGGAATTPSEGGTTSPDESAPKSSD